MIEHAGTQGAKQQTWEPDNPRALLKRILDENPNLPEQASRSMMLEQLNADPLRYIPGLLAYWWPSNYRSLTASQRTRQPKPSAVEMVSKLREDLLDLMLSNGKSLRNCTFGECAKEGGWLVELSKQGHPNEFIGQKMTLEQVASFWFQPATQ